MPDVLPEEAPLASEVVDGGVLSRRRKEALGEIRAMLVDRPPEIEPEEWRVIVAELAPPDGHLGRTAGSAPARFGRMQRARECFPLMSASGSLRRYREVLARPKVVEFLGDLRSLEMVDVLEQRAMVREVLHRVLAGVTVLDNEALMLGAPGDWAKVAAVVTGAAKVLVEMDGLKAKAGAADEATSGESADDDAGLAAREVVAKVAADLRARREVPA